MNTSKVVKKQRNIKKKNMCKVSLLNQFNFMSAFTWLNLGTMVKNHQYVITSMKRHKTKYGERLLAELDSTNKLYLPERYNTLTDQQIKEIGSGKYCLINKGMAEGCRFYQLELTAKSEAMDDAMDVPSMAVASAAAPPPPPPPPPPSSIPPPPMPAPAEDDEDVDDDDSSDEEDDLSTINPNDLALQFYKKSLAQPF